MRPLAYKDTHAVWQSRGEYGRLALRAHRLIVRPGFRDAIDSVLSSIDSSGTVALVRGPGRRRGVMLGATIDGKIATARAVRHGAEFARVRRAEGCRFGRTTRPRSFRDNLRPASNLALLTIGGGSCVSSASIWRCRTRAGALDEAEHAIGRWRDTQKNRAERRISRAHEQSDTRLKLITGAGRICLPSPGAFCTLCHRVAVD